MSYNSNYKGKEVEEILDSVSNKQEKLVSGTNIKTINGASILGSGNIEIQGGGSSSSGSAYPLVNHGTSDTTFTLTPNTFHVWDEVSALDLSFGEETEGLANEYLFQFTSGATATSLTLPDDIKWANDSAPTIMENMIYQVSILKGLASVLEFSNKAPSVPIVFYVNGVEYNAEDGMSWTDFAESKYNEQEYNGETIPLCSIYEPYDVYWFVEEEGEMVEIPLFENYDELVQTTLFDTIIANHNYTAMWP